jgi:murein DD-endopeptidase MepM/ murein hydrolase activator NlpD
VAVGFLLFDYWRIRIDNPEVSRLRLERQVYEKKTRQLSKDMDILRRDMVVLAQNDAQVRSMHQLPVAKIDNPVGVGGPAEVAPKRISRIQEEIDQLRVAIELRRQSQEEIRGLFNDQRSVFSAKPSGWPVKGWLTSLFGRRKSPFSGRRVFHEGIDIACRTGTLIISSADGIVSFAGIKSGYGKIVIIDHGYGYQTCYAHNSKIFVKVGQRVKRGEKVAAVGNTGRSTGSHLHYEVRLNGAPVNPKKYL